MMDNAFKIMKILDDHGFETRITGGAVRDKLMGISPKDVDLATTARPTQVLIAFAELGYTVLETGLQHGTVTVMMDDVPYEVTTLRIDTNHDGRHAEVEFTDDWKLDASRRDFTMNAMFMDIDGQIHDYFGGVDDVRASRVKFVGDAESRIKEDYLRIMRYFRFLARFQCDGDLATIRAIENTRNGLQKISRERIFVEVSKIFTYDHNDVYHLLNFSGVSIEIFGKFIGPYYHVPFDDWFLVAMFMGVDSNWFIEYKAPKEIINEVKFHENFVPSEIRYDVFKHGKKRMLNHSKLIGEPYFQHFKDRFINFEIPKFPVNGHDLIAKNFKGSEIGHELERLQRKWAASDFKLIKEELIN